VKLPRLQKRPLLASKLDSFALPVPLFLAGALAAVIPPGIDNRWLKWIADRIADAEHSDLSMDIAHAGFRRGTPTLAADEVHLWRVDLEAAAPDEQRWRTVLSAGEQARADRFHFRRHRQHFAAGRAILRHVLAGYLGADPDKLIFVYSSKDKPALGDSHAASGLAFNISHSGGIALIACTRNRQIGVDVEQIRSNSDTAAISKRFFSSSEQRELAALPAEQQQEAFFRVWTRKEAYIKATGEGLSLPLHQFDVSLAPHHQDALLSTRPDQREAKRWSLRDLPVQSGYAAAVCVSGTDWKLIDIPLIIPNIDESGIDPPESDGPR
jgi:4'-phosphopantetheinyl transferase